MIKTVHDKDKRTLVLFGRQYHWVLGPKGYELAKGPAPRKEGS